MKKGKHQIVQRVILNHKIDNFVYPYVFTVLLGILIVLLVEAIILKEKNTMHSFWEVVLSFALKGKQMYYCSSEETLI